MIQMQKMLSKTISKAGWEDNKLQIEFPNGTVYLYDDVTLEEWQKIRVSQSVGKSLRELVVNPGKSYKRII